MTKRISENTMPRRHHDDIATCPEAMSHHRVLTASADLLFEADELSEATRAELRTLLASRIAAFENVVTGGPADPITEANRPSLPPRGGMVL